MIPTSLAGPHLPLLLLIVKATILLVAALGSTLAMQRSSAGARHLVWLVTLTTLLLVPALAAWAPVRLRILPAERETWPVVGTSTKWTAVAPSMQTSVGAAGAAERFAIERATAQPKPLGVIARLRAMSGVAIVVAVWAAVALGFLLSLAWSTFAVSRIVRRARLLDTPDWLGPLYEVSDRLGLDEPPRLLRSEDAKMPFACGMLTPTIVLPAECDGWSLDRRRAVLLHELAHVRRHDLVGHTLGRLACAAYWFHPLVWTAAKQLRAESERACDDLALACGTRATDYAEHLLDIVTSVRGDGTPAVALAMARRKEFEGRMLAILDPELRRATPSRRQSAALIGALALVAVAVGAAAPAPREPQVAMRAAPDSGVRVHPDSSVRAHPDSGVRLRPDSGRRVRPDSGWRAHPDTGWSARPDGPRLGALDDFVASVTKTTTKATLNALMRSGIVPQGTRADTDDRANLLAKVLRTDTSATLRRVAAWGLSEYAEQQVASEALASALKRDPNATVREMAAWSLGRAGECGGAAEALGAALRSDADQRVRATSAWALSETGNCAPVDVLAAALADANPDVRMRAAWALGRAEPKEAPRALVALLGDKDSRVRELAAWSLSRIADARTAPALEAALKTETDKDVQLADIRALAALGEQSVDAIRGLLESSDPRVKSMAVHALAGGHAAGPWPWPWPQPRPYP